MNLIEHYIEDAARELCAQRGMTPNRIEYDFEMGYAKRDIQDHLDIQRAISYADTQVARHRQNELDD